MLGYYQPSASSQLRILYEEGDPGELQLGYYYDELHSPPSELDLRQGKVRDKYNCLSMK